jgi:hypothetical protein
MPGRTKSTEIEAKRRAKISATLKHLYATGQRTPISYLEGVADKISLANTGKIPWNKGKHGVQDYSNNCPKCNKFGMKDKSHFCKYGNFGHPHTERTKLLISEHRKGKPAWNKGKGKQPAKDKKPKIYDENGNRHLTEEHKKHISESGKGKHYHSEETRLKLKLSHSTSEAKLAQSIKRSKQVFPFKDTKIEIKVQEYLSSKGLVKYVDYIPHKAFRVGKTHHQVDIYIPKTDAKIECDGTYWHSSVSAILRDFEIDIVLHPIRLKETEIKDDTFKNKLDKVI